MQVPMHITQVVTRQARGMHWDVGENQSTAHRAVAGVEECSPHVLKVLREVPQGTLVVISSD
jgi:hypothetical protein